MKDSKSPNLFSRLMAVAVSLLTLFVAPAVFAAPAAWTGGAASGVWATGGNWSPAAAPGTGDTATFNAAGNPSFLTLDLGAGITISNLTFDTASVASYTIGSGAAGSQTLTLGQANGGITVNSTVANNQLFNANLALATTGTYNVTNNSANSLTLAGGISASTAGAKVLTVNGAGNTTISGNIASGAGSVAVTKTGTGTLTLSGLITNAAATTVSGGTLNLTGTITNAAAMNVANANGNVAVLKISGNVTNLQLFVGAGSTIGSAGTGAVYQVSGAVRFTQAQGDGNCSLGGAGSSSAIGAYGYYNISGGTLDVPGGIITVGSRTSATAGNNGYGVLDILGGTVSAGSFITIGRSSASATTAGAGVVNVIGGTLNAAAVTANSGLYMGYSPALDVVNVGGGSGAAAVTMQGAAAASTLAGVDIANVNLTGSTTVINLITNGTMTTPNIHGSGANNTSYLNFIGGTLKASSVNWGTTFMTSANIDNVVVYSGGGTVDNNGTAITISRPMTPPTGNGVATIPVSAGGAGYIGAPLVFISGDGVGATAYAQIDSSTGNATSGQLTNIVVTCPGQNYTTASVTLVGGGATTVPTIGTITFNAGNASGGMTFSGSGTTILGAVNTYTGPTLVTGGTLAVDPTVAGIGGSLVVSNGGLNLTLNTAGTYNSSAMTVNNLTLATGTSTFTFNYGQLSGIPTAAITASGSLTKNGSAVINISGTGFVVGQFPLITYSGAPVTTNNITLGTLPAGVSAVLTNTGSSLDLVVTTAGGLLTWIGAVDNVSATPLTSWNVNTSSNWYNSFSATYGTKFLQADNVTFDDSLNTTAGLDGSGAATVNLTTTVNPATLTVNNSTYPYRFVGAGAIGGKVSLNKNGSATLFVGNANSYTGGTFINTGTLAITNDNALGNVTNSVTLAGGTLQLSNGVSSARAISATADSSVGASGSVTLSGAITGAGGLTKVDNGTLTLSGTSSYAGATTVSQGTLNLSGTISNAATVKVGLIAGNNAILKITNNLNALNLLVGVDTADGAVYQTNGAVSFSQAQGDANFSLGGDGTSSAFGGYGYYNISGGTLFGNLLTVGSRTSASSSGYGVMDVKGGTVNSGSFVTIGRSGAAATTSGAGVLSVSGGTVNAGISNANSGLYLGYSLGTDVANIGGGASAATFNIIGSGTGNTLAGVDIANVNVAGFTVINLLPNGALVTPNIHGASAAQSSSLNFNGGTLKAAALNWGTTFFASTNVDNVMVYANGGTVDNNGTAISIANVLAAPAGSGVVTITVSSKGSNYLGAPIVVIPDGTANNGNLATAVANMESDGSANGTFRVASITVTSPGDYSVVPTTVSFIGGGSSATAAVAAIGTTGVNASGGLAFNGAGTSRLTGTNTYTGNSTINNGTLEVDGVVAGKVIVKSGATLAGAGSVTGAVTNESGGFLAPGINTNGTLTITGNLTLKTGSTNVFEVNGSTPTNDIVVLGGSVSYGGVLNIVTNGTFTAGQSFTLFSGAGATTAGNFASLTGSPGSGLAFSFTNGVLSVVATATVNTNPTNITAVVNGGNLELTWPADHTGWRLQAQTNSLSNGLGTNWVAVPGSTAVHSVTNAINPANGAVFYRMVYP